MYNLYDLIKELCDESNITPGKMCSDIGISRGLITDLKMGRKQTATGNTLKKIAEYFNVSVDYLLTGEKNTPDNLSEVEELAEAMKDNPGMRVLFSKTKNTTKEDLEKIIKMIDIMKGTNNE